MSCGGNHAKNRKRIFLGEIACEQDALRRKKYDLIALCMNVSPPGPELHCPAPESEFEQVSVVKPVRFDEPGVDESGGGSRPNSAKHLQKVLALVRQLQRLHTVLEDLGHAPERFHSETVLWMEIGEG
ncbi:hypothetical protein [Bradyrhizobium manausense]|uniref:hypothetical protein n=1 Tax=Bradyrhizobium manausense TaxID=989370 RepID=UPI001BACCF8D|nr:hypothetical protein [Bradyrhizobium manausense]